MKPKALISFIKKQLDDNKALDVAELDVKKLSDCMDVMLIATGTSTRHVKSIAKKLVNALKESDVRPLGVEGEIDGEWVLVDLGDTVVHIMLQSQRELYNLEELWAQVKERKQSNTQKHARSERQRTE